MVLTKHAALHRMNKSELLDYITEYGMAPTDDMEGAMMELRSKTREELIAIAREKSIAEGTFRGR